MKQEAMQYFPDINLTVAGMLIFLLVFIGVILWVWRKGSTEVYEAASQLPLKKEDKSE